MQSRKSLSRVALEGKILILTFIINTQDFPCMDYMNLYWAQFKGQFPLFYPSYIILSFGWLMTLKLGHVEDFIETISAILSVLFNVY